MIGFGADAEIFSVWELRELKFVFRFDFAKRMDGFKDLDDSVFDRNR
jgi:hypothetical protein